jgi:hypothetical protein
MSTTWDEEFGARFKSLSDRDVEIWQEIIEIEIKNLHSGEVLSAVRSLGEQKRKGEIKYTPTVENIISAIIKNRYLSRNERENFGPDKKCALCTGGYLVYIITRMPDGTERIGKVDGRGYDTESIPCLCSAGEKRLKVVYPESAHGKIRDRAQRAMDWIAEIPDNTEYDLMRFKKCA